MALDASGVGRGDDGWKRRRRWRRKSGEGVAPLLKPRDPHLADWEKQD